MTEREIFLAVLDLHDPTARAAYLDKACADDPALRTRIDALIASHDGAASFLGSPAVSGVASPDFATGLTQDVNSCESSDDESDADEAISFLQKSDRPDSLGRIGHYEVLQILGKGAFGIVYRAFDDTLQRVVAIKVLAAQIAATSPARKRFLREARSSAKVRHENVVQVYAVEEQPLPYIVMEFIPGETLQQQLDRRGPLEPLETISIGRQVAEALAAAHSQGLIHRDIKPGNILIESGVNHQVKITDFGLARAADDASMTQSGMILGTPLFMAPEQAHGQKLDHRADLFSLGSVLYTMCSGRPPFRASSTLAVLTRVANDTPRPIPEIIPEVPKWLCDIIAKLHAKNPEERFQTARELADLLAECERKLKGKQEVQYSLGASTTQKIAQPAPVASGAAAQPKPLAIVAPARREKWKIFAAILLLGIFVLATAEFAGVTHFFRGEPPAPEVTQPDTNPARVAIAKQKSARVVSAKVAAPLPPPVAVGPFTDADAQRLAALPPAAQAEEVRRELMKHNPGFDGPVTPTIENDAMTGLEFSTDAIDNISLLRALNKLKSLKISGSDVGKGKINDLAPLKNLPLTTLECRYTSISDLTPLKDMDLTTLDLRHTNVGDADAKTLAGFKNLQALTLWGTKVTSEGLKELAGLKNLQYLSLENTQVTDAGLKELAGLQNLKQLSLYAATKVTDASVDDLAHLTALEWLDLRGTSLTDAGRAKLAAARPKLKIETFAAAVDPKDVKAPKPNDKPAGTVRKKGDGATEQF